MRILLVAATVFVWNLSAPAQAQVPEDAMEAQRCVWRCLSNSNGVVDAAYERCVANICNGAAEKPAKKKARKKTKKKKTKRS